MTKALSSPVIGLLATFLVAALLQQNSCGKTAEAREEARLLASMKEIEGIVFDMNSSAFNKPKDLPLTQLRELGAAFRAFPMSYRELFAEFPLTIQPTTQEEWINRGWGPDDDNRAASHNCDSNHKNCTLSFPESGTAGRQAYLHELGHHLQMAIRSLPSVSHALPWQLQRLAKTDGQVKVLLSGFPDVNDTKNLPASGAPGCLRPYSCNNAGEAFADGLAYYRFHNAYFREKMEADLEQEDRRLRDLYAFFEGLYADARSLGSHASSVRPLSPSGHLARGLFVDYRHIGGEVTEIPTDIRLLGNASQLVPHLNWPASDRGIADIPIVDQLVVQFTGGLIVEEAGQYLFQLESDDGAKLYLDHRLLIDNDGVHGMKKKDSSSISLDPGVYAIRVEYFENTGEAGLILRYQPPNRPMEVVPQHVLLPVAGSTLEEYFQADVTEIPDSYDAPPLATAVETRTNENEGGRLVFPPTSSAFRSGLGPGLEDKFAAVFSGTFFARSQGRSTLGLRSDDGSLLLLAKTLVVDNDGIHSMQEQTGTIELLPGLHEFVLFYFDQTGEAGLEVSLNGKHLPWTQLAPVRLGLKSEFFRLAQGVEKLPDFEDLTFEYSVLVPRIDYRTMEQFSKQPDDHFAIRFSGSLLIEEAGEYELFLTSDDGSALYLDGRPLIVNDGLHPMQEIGSGSIFLGSGPHDIELRYFQAGGESGVRLAIQPPGGREQRIVPATMLSPFRGGVLAEFYYLDSPVDSLAQINGILENDTPDLVRRLANLSIGMKSVDELLEVLGGLNLPRSRNPLDNFAARFSSWLYVPFDGDYTLALACDDGGRLSLDDSAVITHDNSHPVTERSGVVALKAGFHKLVIEHFNAGGDVGITLSWGMPTGLRYENWQVIPPENFFARPPERFGPTRQY